MERVGAANRTTTERHGRQARASQHDLRNVVLCGPTTARSRPHEAYQGWRLRAMGSAETRDRGPRHISSESPHTSTHVLAELLTGRVDEGDPHAPVFDIRVLAAIALERLSILIRAHILLEAAMQTARKRHGTLPDGRRESSVRPSTPRADRPGIRRSARWRPDSRSAPADRGASFSALPDIPAATRANPSCR